MLAGYVPLASQSTYPIIVYFLANYRPHLSHFPFMHQPYQSFKRSSKNELTQFFKVNKEHFTVYFIVKFNKQQLSDFFNWELSHFESLLTQKI